MNFYSNLTIFFLANPNFEENELILWLFWPKTHVCVVVAKIILFQSQHCLIRKVHEAWDGNHGQFSSPTSQFSIKTVLMLVENGLVLLLLWPKTHVCIVVDWYYTSLNSILVHYQGS